MLSLFPLAELRSEFFFIIIISPPHSLCVVYVALTPTAGLALSVFSLLCWSDGRCCQIRMQAASLLSKLRFCPRLTLKGKDAARGDNYHGKGFLMGPAAVQESSRIPWTGLGSKHPPWSGQSMLCCGLPQHPCVTRFAGTPCHPDPHLPSLTHHHSRSSISGPSPENTGHPFPAPPAETPPSWSCQQQGPALAGPQSLCTRSWQPHTVSTEHTLGSAHRQHGVSAPSAPLCPY